MEIKDIIQMVLTILGSGAALGFVEFLIKRKDERQDKKEEKEDTTKKDIADLKETMTTGFIEMQKEFQKKLDQSSQENREKFEAHKTNIKVLADGMQSIVNDNKLTKEMSETVGEAIIGLTHDKLVYLTDKITRRKAITYKEQANLKSLYVPYKKLGGNGTGEAGYKHCMDLPVVTDDEAEEMDNQIKRKDLGL